MKEKLLRELISDTIRASMPYFKSDDLDEYFYLVRPNEVGIVVEQIYRLFRDIEEKKPYTLE